MSKINKLDWEHKNWKKALDPDEPTRYHYLAKDYNATQTKQDEIIDQVNTNTDDIANLPNNDTIKDLDKRVTKNTNDIANIDTVIDKEVEPLKEQVDKNTSDIKTINSDLVNISQIQQDHDKQIKTNTTDISSLKANKQDKLNLKEATLIFDDNSTMEVEFIIK